MTRPELQVRRAWRRAYGLLGDLLCEGVDEARLFTIRELPSLSEGLGPQLDLDELAAQHHALLRRELYPYAGVYLGPEGLVGSTAAPELLRAAHRVIGRTAPEEPSLDHLGQGLRTLAVLVDAELDAMHHDDDADLRTLRGWQRRVLDEVLLPWMPPLLAALGDQPPSLWSRAIEMAAGVLARHRDVDPGLPTVGLPAHPGVEVEAVLDDPRTDLRAVASLLVTTVRSGAHFAPRDLEWVARRAELPLGFGSRRDRLERMLRSAAEYGAMPRLVEALDERLRTRDLRYAVLAQEPGLGPHVLHWRRQLASSRALLARLGRAAARPRPAAALGRAP